MTQKSWRSKAFWEMGVLSSLSEDLLLASLCGGTAVSQEMWTIGGDASEWLITMAGSGTEKYRGH